MYSKKTERFAIVTCTYGPDAIRCQRLCASVDRFVPNTVQHHLIVPKRDIHLFSSMRSDRRHIHFVEDVVPGGFIRAPVVRKWWFSARGWPVRGWIMQQIAKLSVDHVADEELLLFADSDIQFIRPLDQNLMLSGQRLRLHRIAGANQQGLHLRWHYRAAELLGLKPCYFGSDYVGQLISWRRGNLMALKKHMEQVHGRPWHELVAGSLHFSEYILYGAFVEHMLTEKHNGHFYCNDDICHCCWHPEHIESLGNGAALVNDRAQALLLQSNLGLNPKQEERLLSVVQEQIASPYPSGGWDHEKAVIYHPGTAISRPQRRQGEKPKVTGGACRSL